MASISSIQEKPVYQEQEKRTSFSNLTGLPLRACTLVSRYLGNKETQGAKKIFGDFDILPASIDLTKEEVLKSYLAQGSFLGLHQALKIASSIYQVNPRSIAHTGNWGQAFSMEPEVLAYAMQIAKDQTVLEIAGASGENAILLAFAGAKRIYMNDIEQQEMARFKSLKSQLPDPVQSKLIPLEGSCFDLLEKTPQLSNQVDLILCRNFIHFLTTQELTDFFGLVKTALKPDGQAIFTVNSIYVLNSSGKEICKAHPQATSFVTRQCLITDLDRSTTPCAVPYRDIAVYPEHLFSTGFTTLRLYNRNPGESWQVNREQFKQLPLEIQPRIKEAIEKSKETITAIKNGTVRVVSSRFRYYSFQTLSQLVKAHGFEIETRFLTDFTGHLVEEDGDLFGKQVKIGVIVRKRAGDPHPSQADQQRGAGAPQAESKENPR